MDRNSKYKWHFYCYRLVQEEYCDAYFNVHKGEYAGHSQKWQSLLLTFFARQQEQVRQKVRINVLHNSPESVANGLKRTLRGCGDQPLGHSELQNDPVVIVASADSPLLQIASLLTFGWSQCFAVQENDVLQSETEQSSHSSSAGLALQNLLNLKHLTAIGRQTFAGLDVELFQLVFVLVDLAVKQFSLLLLKSR